MSHGLLLLLSPLTKPSPPTREEPRVYVNRHNLKIQADCFYLWRVVLKEAQHMARLQLDASF
jgi:hypothetical protein